MVFPLALVPHDMLVLADSVICVAQDYLANVVSPLADKIIGIVTCTYQGRPRVGF